MLGLSIWFGVYFGVWVVMVVCLYIFRRIERRQWNNGFCDRCGTAFTFWHTEPFEGDRVYNCENCRKQISLTYSVDKLGAYDWQEVENVVVILKEK